LEILRLENTEAQDIGSLLGSLNFGIKNRWLINESQPSRSGKLSFALKQTVIEPGKLFPRHFSQYKEAIYVLDGKGIIQTESEEIAIKSGDTILTKCGEEYSVINSGEIALKTLSCLDLLSR
jgi:quercetin dioxygenase-like cupin family protein